MTQSTFDVLVFCLVIELFGKLGSFLYCWAKFMLRGTNKVGSDGQFLGFTDGIIRNRLPVLGDLRRDCHSIIL